MISGALCRDLSTQLDAAATRHGVVCHAVVVLPADIFIGGRATCNRLRGIRTERCFAHLYPRFTVRPIQRQASLPVSHSILPRSLSHLPFIPSFFLSLHSFLSVSHSILSTLCDCVNHHCPVLLGCRCYGIMGCGFPIY